jgi:hypothetical protein
MKNRSNLAIACIVLAFVALGCTSMMKGKGAAEPAVAKFHQQFSDKQFTQIYAESSNKFKSATTEQELVDLLDAIHRKLGTVKDAKSTSWKVNSTTDGTFVYMTYDTEFTEGKGDEQFVFEMDGDKAILAGYHINSNALITK